MSIGIIETGIGLGEIIQTNEELSDIVKNYDSEKSGLTLDQWLKKFYGIESRTKTNLLPSDLATIACTNALKKSNISIEEVDFLVLNTASGDYKQPTTATEVQRKLGMKSNSFALEINMPCAGNIYGLATAYSFLKSEVGKVGLVVGVDKMSSIINQEDFIMAGIFGDAASACLVGDNSKLEIKNIYLRSKADENKALAMKASGSAYPLDKYLVANNDHLLKMKGKETISFIEESLKDTFENLCKLSQLKVQEVGQIIVHQASKPTIERVFKELGMSNKQYLFTLDKYGNTSSASILLTLDDYLNSNSIPENIFLIGMGSGLNWGGIVLKRTI
jgi:3-oxoacyl-[acyl-carrier-protein] synthase-3